MDKFYIDIREQSLQIQRIFKNKDIISVEDLIAKIEELDDDLSNTEEKLEDLKQDLEDNYEPKKIDPYEEYGVSRYDFL